MQMLAQRILPSQNYDLGVVLMMLWCFGVMLVVHAIPNIFLPACRRNMDLLQVRAFPPNHGSRHHTSSKESSLRGAGPTCTIWSASRVESTQAHFLSFAPVHFVPRHWTGREGGREMKLRNKCENCVILKSIQEGLKRAWNYSTGNHFKEV